MSNTIHSDNDQTRRVTLQRREERPVCKGDDEDAEYNIPLHVTSLFVILTISISACAFPMLVIRFPQLRIPSKFLFVVRHFGTGVLLATAFVHLLPTAFISLLDPCLSYVWTDGYPAMAGAIVLAAVFFVAAIEMVFGSGQHLCKEYDNAVATGGKSNGLDFVDQSMDARQSTSKHEETYHGPHYSTNIVTEDGSLIRELGTHKGNSASIGRGLSRINDDNKDTEKVTNVSHIENASSPPNSSEEGGSGSGSTSSKTLSYHNLFLTKEQRYKKEKLQLMLLELGILFHSIFIGMALSVTVGSVFVILWIAVSFHRKSRNRTPNHLHIDMTTR